MSTTENNRRYALALKREVLAHYGESCAHCGFSDIRALTLDHIDNNGAEDRRSLFGDGQKGAGNVFYRRLKKLGWPEGFQTLCFNCNYIKFMESRGHYGDAGEVGNHTPL